MIVITLNPTVSEAWQCKIMSEKATATPTNPPYSSPTGHNKPIVGTPGVNATSSMKISSVSAQQQEISTLLDTLEKRSRAAAATGQNEASFDPIAFINMYYKSEAALTSHLEPLRAAVNDKLEVLDDRIAAALQRHSETASSTRKHVQDARASVSELQSRLLQIRSKASESERAVLDITKDLKRLDCAKRQLQRTITTLKRLHMLVHAVDQLRVVCLSCLEKKKNEPNGEAGGAADDGSLAGPTPSTPIVPDYTTAAHLIEATRLLLSHFESYTMKIQPLRILSAKVESYQLTLNTSFVQSVRVVAFGPSKAKELLQESATGKKNGAPIPLAEIPVLSVPELKGGVLLIDALGETNRDRFIQQFCQDQLVSYILDFMPPSKEPAKPEKRVSSFKVQDTKSEPEASPASLDQLEKRFAWFQDVCDRMDMKFPDVFPPHWNLQAKLTAKFLQVVSWESP